MIEEPFSDFAKHVIFASDFSSEGPGAEPPGKLESVREGQNFHGGYIPPAQNRNCWAGPSV